MAIVKPDAKMTAKKGKKVAGADVKVRHKVEEERIDGRFSDN